jgi:hypothetical protein
MGTTSFNFEYELQCLGSGWLCWLAVWSNDWRVVGQVGPSIACTGAGFLVGRSATLPATRQAPVDTVRISHPSERQCALTAQLDRRSLMLAA